MSNILVKMEMMSMSFKTKTIKDQTGDDGDIVHHSEAWMAPSEFVFINSLTSDVSSLSS